MTNESNSKDFDIENGVLTKYTGSNGDVVIPEGITSIGDNAFSGCSSLESITLPEGVTSIGWGAFRDCSSLKSITLPEEVTSIGESAFSGCAHLIIRSKKGSYAEQYAKENRIPFEALEE